ncbi:MAG: hypothetical protein Q9218_005218, partial [Villophora microphyllina]
MSPKGKGKAKATPPPPDASDSDRGSHYEDIRGDGSRQFPGPDPFAVVGLPANDPLHTKRSIGLHVRKVVSPHVYERGQVKGLTQGKTVPTWSQVNEARDKLLVDQSTLDATRKFWLGKGSKVVWNPFAEIGSDAARRGSKTPRKFVLHADLKSGTNPFFLHAVPKSYYTATAEDVADEHFGASNAPPRTPAKSATKPDLGTSYWNPVNVDHDDDPFVGNHPAFEGYFRGPYNAYMQATAGKTTGGVSAASSRSSPIFPPSRQPATPSKRRQDPKGVMIGTWKHSFPGSPSASRGNAVYASRDRNGRVCRRLSKEDPDGNVVVGGQFHAKKTNVKHKDVLHVGEFEGLDKEQVEAR